MVAALSFLGASVPNSTLDYLSGWRLQGHSGGARQASQALAHSVSAARGHGGLYLRGECCKALGTHASSGAAASPPTHGDGERFSLAFVTKLVKVSRAFAYVYLVA